MKKLGNQLWAYAIDCMLWFYMILASYIIIYQKIILNLRHQDFSWPTSLYSLLAAAVVSLLLFKVKRASLGKVVKGIYKSPIPRPFYMKFYALLSIYAIVLTFVSGLVITELSFTEFFSESCLKGAQRIFSALFTPNWSILDQAIIVAIETIYMAFIATIFAIPTAFLLSFFAARNLMNHSKILMLVYSLARFVMNMTRSIEPLVWAIIFSVWVGIGPFAGMLSLCLHSIASLSKLYSEQIENIDNGPIEAMTATGAHPIQVIWYGVVPQIILPFLSFTIYRWDINVRMATIIGLVGGGGIGTMLMQYQGLAKWNEVGLLVLVIAFIVWVMDYTSAKIREAIK